MAQEFIDKSGDKEFFTVIPNIIVNGYNAVESGVYLYIKRRCGEEGQFYETQQETCKKLGISRPTYRKILQKLEQDGRIRTVGWKKYKTHPVRVYEICNIWEENKARYGKNKTTSSRDMEKIRPLLKEKKEKKQKKEKKNNISFLRKDTRANRPKVPKEDIDEVIDFLKSIIKVDELDGSRQKNRLYAYHCLLKFGGPANVKKIIKIASLDKFHRRNLTSFKYLYYNAIKIVQAYKEKLRKEKSRDLEYYEKKMQEFKRKIKQNL